MSKHDKDFDQYIKKAVEGKTFEFDEAYWEAARQLVDRKLPVGQPRRFRGGGVLGMVIFLITWAGAIAWPWLYEPGFEGSAQAWSGTRNAPDSFVVRDIYWETPEKEFSFPEGKSVSPSTARASKGQTSPAGVVEGANSPQNLFSRKEMNTRKQEGGGEQVDGQRRVPGGKTRSTKSDPEDVRLLSIGREDTLDGNAALIPGNTLLWPIDVQTPTWSAQLDLTGKSPLQVPIEKRQRDNPMPRHQVGLIFGANLSPGLKNGADQRAGWSTHPLVGVRYAYRLQPRLALSAGAQVQGRGGLNAGRSYESLTYGFGYEREITTLIPQRAYFLNIPLLAQYQIKGPHTLHLGLSYARLLGAQVAKEVYQEDSFSLRLGGESANDWGITQGIARQDLGILLGYGYYLGKGWHLGWETQYGLNDLTPDSFYQNQTIDHNLQIRVHLTYDLIRYK